MLDQKAKDGGERKTERLNDGNSNGQAMHGARKPPGPICSSIFFMYIFILSLSEFILIIASLASLNNGCIGQVNYSSSKDSIISNT